MHHLELELSEEELASLLAAIALEIEDTQKTIDNPICLKEAKIVLEKHLVNLRTVYRKLRKEH